MARFYDENHNELGWASTTDGMNAFILENANDLHFVKIEDEADLEVISEMWIENGVTDGELREYAEAGCPFAVVGWYYWDCELNSWMPHYE